MQRGEGERRTELGADKQRQVCTADSSADTSADIHGERNIPRVCVRPLLLSYVEISTLFKIRWWVFWRSPRKVLRSGCGCLDCCRVDLSVGNGPRSRCQSDVSVGIEFQDKQMGRMSVVCRLDVVRSLGRDVCVF